MQYSAVSGLSAGSLGCVCGVVWGEWKGKEEGGLDSILGVAVGWGEIAFALGQLLLEGGGGFGGFFGACFIAGWCCVVFGVGVGWDFYTCAFLVGWLLSYISGNGVGVLRFGFVMERLSWLWILGRYLI